MEHYKELALGVVKVAVAWLGVALGHVIDSVTLSNAASAAAIIYSVVHTYAALKSMRSEK